MKPPPDNLDVTHLRGRIAGLIRASVLATLTEAQRTHLRGFLSEAAVELLDRAPDPDGWVPTPLLAEFLGQARQLSPLRTARSRAQMQADLLMEGSPELRGLTPREVIARLPWLFGEVHRGGELAILELTDDHAVVLLKARYPYPEWYTEVLPAWIHRALERAGAKEIQVQHEAPGPTSEPWAHAYHLNWVG